MGRLVYSAICSVDGYVEDATGGFGWAAPDEEVHGFVNDLERPVSTYLYGRRMFETMRFWETADTPDEPEVIRDYARIWQGADKVVFSRTLDAVTTPHTRIERSFEPAQVRRMVESAEGEVSVGGAELAGAALQAGLVDEVRLLTVPALVGGGKPALPRDVRLDLELVGSRDFGNGTTYRRYRVRGT
ncbi:MAG TPA: dihydrofolate reductase family protein [Marmoricola sp.]|nr:dihydrofolate reductase family protein [Marmoricola sp.]